MGVWTNKGGGVPRVIEEGVRIKSPLAPSHCLNITYKQWPKENLPSLRGAVQKNFWANLGFWPNEGGGSRQSQLFIKIAQNLICLGTVHKCDETHST